MVNFWKKLPRPFTILAPMEEVTDMAFREMVSNFLPRPTVFFTEFVSADGIVYNPKVLDKLAFSNKQRPIVAQIWGTNLINLEQAAKTVTKLGFDGIDINMGCPANDVVKTGGGAGQIKDFARASQVILAVRNATSIPVSVKTRLGFDKIITEDWIGLLLEQHLAAITVHARTAKQMSQGAANWEEIGKVVKMAAGKTLIIGNGDVKSYLEILDKHIRYGVDGIMIGRGIFQNPWIFSSETPQVSKDEKLALLQKHRDLVKLYGGSINHFLKMWLNGFPGAKELRVRYLE